MGRWIAVVGSRGEGREDVVRRLARALQAAGVGVGGFVQVPHFGAANELLGFDLLSLANGESAPLARHARSRDPDLCDWDFSIGGFEKAGDWVSAQPCDVCFLEAGRLEAAEQGHWSTILQAIDQRPLTVIGIRRSVLASVVLRLPDPVDAIELPAEAEEVDRFFVRVRRGYAEEQE